MRLKVIVEQPSMGAFILLHKNSQQGSGGGGSGHSCGSRGGEVAVTMVAKEAVAAMVVVCLHDNTNHV